MKHRLKIFLLFFCCLHAGWAQGQTTLESFLDSHSGKTTDIRLIPDEIFVQGDLQFDDHLLQQKQVEATSSATVMLYFYRPDGKSRGCSGVFVAPKILATASHCIARSDKLDKILWQLPRPMGATLPLFPLFGQTISKEQLLISRENTAKAKVLLDYPQGDFALLLVNDELLAESPHRFAAIHWSAPASGSLLYILGYPIFTEYPPPFRQWMRLGSLQSFHDEVGSNHSDLDLSITVYEGDSGSPIFDWQSQLIGIVNRWDEQSSNYYAGSFYLYNQLFGLEKLLAGIASSTPEELSKQLVDLKPAIHPRLAFMSDLMNLHRQQQISYLTLQRRDLSPFAKTALPTLQAIQDAAEEYDETMHELAFHLFSGPKLRGGGSLSRLEKPASFDKSGFERETAVFQQKLLQIAVKANQLMVNFLLSADASQKLIEDFVYALTMICSPTMVVTLLDEYLTKTDSAARASLETIQKHLKEYLAKLPINGPKIWSALNRQKFEEQWLVVAKTSPSKKP
jgi:hypothetical protein